MEKPGGEEKAEPNANDQQLQHVPQPYKYVYEHYDVLIDLLSEANTRELSRVDPLKMVLRHRAFEGNMKTLLKRAADRELRWTLSLFPTQAYAQDAEMSLSEFEDFVYQACLPDLNDPIGYWKHFSARQQKIVDLKTLDTDDGARRVGEFAIGPNEGITRFTREILFDEKIGGSFHRAVGADLPETGSLNQSASHWDRICDLRQGGQIWVDDQLLFENGHFTLDL